jgi:hypothetical protein
MNTTVNNSLGLEELKGTRLSDLRTPKYFMVGDNGIENGTLYQYTITRFSKVKREEGLSDRKYDYTCVLVVRIMDKTYKLKCSLSPLLSYRILQNKKRYINVTFESYNTTPEYTCNPLHLVKLINGNYVLYSVTERGRELYTIELPGGEKTTGERFVSNKRENYVRYHEVKRSL